VSCDFDHLSREKRAEKLAAFRRGEAAEAERKKALAVEMFAVQVAYAKATIRDIARNHPGGMTITWEGEAVRLLLPGERQPIDIEDAVRRKLI